MPELWEYAKPGDVAMVTELLQQGGVSKTDFVSAYTAVCGWGSAMFVRIFLANGGRQHINEKDEYGSTPLTKACGAGHDDVVSLLLASGADVKVVDGDGRSPLYQCSRWGCVRCTELVLHTPGGVDMLNAPTNDGWLPLFEACRNGHTAMVQTLLVAGADPHQIFCNKHKVFTSSTTAWTLQQLLAKKAASLVQR
eukprot:NODE_3321_length_912_cov_54.777070_g3299_i0.p1 GENE.NODE_3321_length_912_cov_54.777070_g3299_i0~~NODE_3321_length_912_cov_54.777070_g3299_i0.p1  ORF type:complete len:195 (+),score=35.41 NODE_3321_length_912_cov_54.777070_g3299_i0:74-658(+)